MKKLFFLLLATITTGAYSQQKQELSLNLKEGETYRINQIIDQDIVQTVMGNPMGIKNYMDWSSSYYVREANSSRYLLDIWFTRFKMKISSSFLNMDRYGTTRA